MLYYNENHYVLQDCDKSFTKFRFSFLYNVFFILYPCTAVFLDTAVHVKYDRPIRRIQDFRI